MGDGRGGAVRAGRTALVLHLAAGGDVPLTQSRAWIAAIAGFSTWIMVIFQPDGSHGMYSLIHVLAATARALAAWYALLLRPDRFPQTVRAGAHPTP